MPGSNPPRSGKVKVPPAPPRHRRVTKTTKHTGPLLLLMHHLDNIERRGIGWWSDRYQMSQPEFNLFRHTLENVVKDMTPAEPSMLPEEM